MFLTFSTLQATEADVKLWHLPHFYLETEFDISFKLSPEETICMKWQTLFSWKRNKNIWRCRLPELKVSVAKVNIPVIHIIPGLYAKYHDHTSISSQVVMQKLKKGHNSKTKVLSKKICFNSVFMLIHHKKFQNLSTYYSWVLQQLMVLQ